MFDNSNESTHNNTEADTRPVSPLCVLTKGELEVLRLISLGYSNADIAKAMFISEHTVNDYTKKIYRKLDVHNRHAAAQIFLRHNSSGNSTE
ncbi:MAG: response regulator transcription factor [Ruminococcus sp.]|nr:response regulator transcription factor [Ruminococcus sp.]